MKKLGAKKDVDENAGGSFCHSRDSDESLREVSEKLRKQETRGEVQKKKFQKISID